MKKHTVTLDVISDIVSTSLAISGELIQKPSYLGWLVRQSQNYHSAGAC
ncbi:hypothetical protein O9992_07030 [Vibrio lentus]|nr:hypothetical protein [Vibrio lentus]